jgi:hypothetical protein
MIYRPSIDFSFQNNISCCRGVHQSWQSWKWGLDTLPPSRPEKLEKLFQRGLFPRSLYLRNIKDKVRQKRWKRDLWDEVEKKMVVEKWVQQWYGGREGRWWTRDCGDVESLETPKTEKGEDERRVAVVWWVWKETRREGKWESGDLELGKLGRWRVWKRMNGEKRGKMGF